MQHPLLLVPFSPSRFAIYFCYNFQTANSNELIFSAIMGIAEMHLLMEKETGSLRNTIIKKN
jgi:hypothetical protein